MTLGEALVKLHAMGRLENRWLAGMQAVDTTNGHVRRVDFASDWDDCSPDYAPDLTDPCTVGGLLALLREASGDPTAHVTPVPLGDGEWRAVSRKMPGLPIDGPTEGAAISAAIIALAEATP